MAVTREILKSHKVDTLRKEIKRSNLSDKGSKAELIELMLQHKERFGHIKMNTEPKLQLRPEEKERQEKEKQAKKDERNAKLTEKNTAARKEQDSKKAEEVKQKKIQLATQVYLSTVQERKQAEEKLKAVKKRQKQNKARDDRLGLNKFQVGESITFGGASNERPREDLIRNPIKQTMEGKKRYQQIAGRD